MFIENFSSKSYYNIAIHEYLNIYKHTRRKNIFENFNTLHTPIFFYLLYKTWTIQSVVAKFKGNIHAIRKWI